MGILIGLIVGAFIASLLWSSNTFTYSEVVGNGGAYYDQKGEVHLIDHIKKGEE